jgi:hypothetical protein
MTVFELSPPNTIHQIRVALERLMEEDAEAGRPFIAALVVNKAVFDCARRLGRFTYAPNGVEARSFHAIELNSAQKVGAAPAAVPSSDAAALPDYALAS